VTVLILNFDILPDLIHLQGKGEGPSIAVIRI